MKHQPHISVRDGYILVSHDKCELEGMHAHQIAEELADVCDAHTIHRVLLDERNVTYSNTTTLELLGLGDGLLKDMLVFRFHRVACVPNQEQFHIARDFESLARARGMNYRAFATMEAAEEWLRQGT